MNGNLNNEQPERRVKLKDILFLGGIAVSLIWLTTEAPKLVSKKALKEDVKLILEHSSNIHESWSAGCYPAEITVESSRFSTRKPFVLSLKEEGEKPFYSIGNLDYELCHELCTILDSKNEDGSVSPEYLIKCKETKALDLVNI